MSWIGWAYLIWILLIAPVTVQVRLMLGKEKGVFVLMHIWGIPFKLWPRPVHAAPMKKSSGRKLWIQAFLKQPQVRKAFNLGIQWQYVGIIGILATPRADITALLWGSFQGVKNVLALWLKRKGIPCHFQLMPDFERQSTAIEGSCILFSRLGMLLASGLMLVWAYWRIRAEEKGEADTWSIQSGA